MNAYSGIHSTGCGITTLLSVSRHSPKDVLLRFISQNPVSNKVFVAGAKSYVDVPNQRMIHVIFGGPDMTTLAKSDNHYSSNGSCGALAAYLREHNLGSVIETPPRHNPYHQNRKSGEGDVIVYVWTPDPDALIRWMKENGV